jgi:hypothetical protein
MRAFVSLLTGLHVPTPTFAQRTPEFVANTPQRSPQRVTDAARFVPRHRVQAVGRSRELRTRAKISELCWHSRRSPSALAQSAESVELREGATKARSRQRSQLRSPPVTATRMVAARNGSAIFGRSPNSDFG